jgi:hypothetical protein
MTTPQDDLLKDTLRFLKGSRVPTIALRLSGFGFKDTDWAEGWALMQNVVDSEFTTPGTVNSDTDMLNKLDDWENLWFPIIQAVLTRHNALIAEQLFEGLSQTEGMALIPSLTKLHKRLEDLVSSNDQASLDAVALLDQRGVDATQREALGALLKRAKTFTSPTAINEAAALEQARADGRLLHEQALTALRAYLSEWSLIARAAVKNGNHLRQLGIATPGRPRRPQAR